MLINICFGFMMLIVSLIGYTSVLVLMVAHDDALSLVQTDSGARAAGNLDFLVACLSSAILIQAVNVNTRREEGRGRSDLFPSTHWSVVVAARGMASRTESPTQSATRSMLGNSRTQTFRAFTTSETEKILVRVP
jgi:hypothetical protein